ncbi:MAG: PDZ domain-containing protein [Candidatus Obscuribacterales bacterium]|nr:PDZ domain-containing protein [Candidatus Obscuribacterales bacterium]
MSKKLLTKTKVKGIAAFCFGILLSALPETAVLAQSYQSVEPKLDTSASGRDPQQEVSSLKPGAKLQGGVRKVDNKDKPKQGRMIFGAKKGQSDALKARLKDEGALRAQAESSIGIIGVKFVATYGKPPVINEIFPNTPADKVGLRIYDMIVAVDGVPTTGLTKDEVFDLIVGTPGTQVSLSILRNGDYSSVSCTRMDINELIDPRIRRDYMIHM